MTPFIYCVVEKSEIRFVFNSAVTLLPMGDDPTSQIISDENEMLYRR